VLGLVGINGIGKSTALKILSGNIKPNLGKYEGVPEWKEILKFFRGSELQNYFTRMLEEKMKAIIKIQYVDAVKNTKAAQGIVGRRLKAADKKGILDHVVDMLDLTTIMGNTIETLSGGEL
jgi:ATP-binding cassette subfamily E protein 1